MNPNILSLLGLAKRGSMLVAGEEPVDAVVRSKGARLLLSASDAAENTARRVRHFAETGACLLLQLPFTKEELGHAVGLTSCAVVALTDIGFAANIARRMAAEDPSFGEYAEKLEIKAQRAAERKAEREVHEKRSRQDPKKAARVPENKPEQPVKSGAPQKFTQSKPGAGSGRQSGPGAPKRFDGPRPGGNSGRQSGPGAPKRFDGPRPGGNSDQRTGPGTPRQFDDPRRGAKPAWSARPAPQKRFDRPKTAAGSERQGERTVNGPYPPRTPSRTPSGARTPHRPFQSEHRGAAPSRPFAHSHPVKKGKGSFRKKDGS